MFVSDLNSFPISIHSPSGPFTSKCNFLEILTSTKIFENEKLTKKGKYYFARKSQWKSNGLLKTFVTAISTIMLKHQMDKCHKQEHCSKHSNPSQNKPVPCNYLLQHLPELYLQACQLPVLPFGPRPICRPFQPYNNQIRQMCHTFLPGSKRVQGRCGHSWCLE